MIKGFKNVRVYVNGLGIVRKSVAVRSGKIYKIADKIEGDDDFLTLDEGKILVPGFIDKHMHGANNSDGMYPTLEDQKNIAATVAKDGVTAYLITTMTETIPNIMKALQACASYIDNFNYEGARPLGIHLEGPFISKKYKGAQAETNIKKCSLPLFKEFLEAANNHIMQVTLACEENGSELIPFLKENKIVASIGHSNATYDECMQAIKEGVSSFTHTYNAMRPIHHREVGVVGSAMLAEGTYCEMICDLIHLSAPAIRLLYKTKGKDYLIVVTDGIEARHLPNGKYRLGGQDVYVENGVARLIDGTLAGSTLLMNVALRNVKKVLHLSLPDTIDLATINPAKNLGLKSKGMIKVGMDADFTVIDEDFNVYLTVLEGRIIYQK